MWEELRWLMVCVGGRLEPNVPLMFSGTVLVQPEPADNGRDGFRGPEFCSRKPNVLSRRRGGQSLLDFINCRMLGYCSH